MLLSIIIPAYNAGKYLEQCLNSLILNDTNITYEYEVIIINDGSKDNTDEIASKFADKYSFINYIEQKNAGVSAARNAGLKAATGKYITFVDADDTLLELNKILEILSSSNDELIIGDFHEINTDGKIICSRQLSKSIGNSRKALDKEILGNYLLNTCWGKFYLNNIIQKHQIEFPLGVKMGEDLIFVLNYMNYIKNFKCIPLYIYNYLQLDSGAVRRLRSQITPEIIRDKTLCIQAKKKYMDIHTISNDILCTYYEYQLADIVSTINMMLKAGHTLSQEYKYLRELVTAPELKEILQFSIKHNGISKKRRVVAFIYLHKVSSIFYILGKHKKQT